MSTFHSTVHLPAVSSLWPRARRLLALAFAAAVVAVVAVVAVAATATAAPHAVATAVVHLQRWMAARSELEVFLALVGLFAVVVGISIATAIDREIDQEVFDVR